MQFCGIGNCCKGRHKIIIWERERGLVVETCVPREERGVQLQLHVSKGTGVEQGAKRSSDIPQQLQSTLTCGPTRVPISPSYVATFIGQLGGAITQKLVISLIHTPPMSRSHTNYSICAIIMSTCDWVRDHTVLQ